ncbi:MAG: tetratricopeptide repeat protein [Chloroflexota bacterium]|nr:tetratricopeptide repeat protein [Chloroflexota bacterium]
MIGLIAHYLEVGGHWAEIRGWIGRLVAKVGESADPGWRAEASLHAALAEHYCGDYDAARSSAARGVALFRELGDKSRLAEMLEAFGTILQEEGDFAAARPFFEESLDIYRDLKDSLGVAWSSAHLGLTVCVLGDLGLGHACLEESLEISRKGKWKFVNSRSAYHLGELLRHEGNIAQARPLYKEAVACTKVGADWALVYAIDAFAKLAVAGRLFVRAAKLFGANEHLYAMFETVRYPSMQSEYDGAVANLRAALSQEEFANAWAEGRAMTLEQAAAYALEDLDSPPA